MRWLVLVPCFLSTGFANAASFDCAKAATDAERIVCADVYLSHVDEALSKIYQVALKKLQHREAVRNEQRQWIEKRDACRDLKCVYEAYTTRLQALNVALFENRGMGLYRCSWDAPGTENPTQGVDFEIKDGIISDFHAVTSFASEELARGYTNTCTQHRGNFYQVRGGKKCTLQFNQPQNDGESLECQVHIEDLGDKFHVYSSQCVSECMNFDFQVNKNSKDCYHTP